MIKHYWPQPQPHTQLLPQSHPLPPRRLNSIVLTLLRQLELEVLNLHRLLVTLVVVQGINNTLGIGVYVIDNIASLLLSFIPYLRETLSDDSADITLAVAKFASIFAVLKLNIGTEVCNLALSLAAAILKNLDNITVAKINCVNNTLSRKAELTSDLLNSCLNIAATLLKSVEVEIKCLRKSADSKCITLNSVLNTVSIRSVLQLSTNDIELSLSFNTLSACTISVSKAKASIAEKSHKHHIGKWIIHLIVHASTHHGCYRTPIVFTIITC